MSYPARLIPEEDGMVMLTLPDVPEVVVVEVGEQAALARAPAVLESVLAGYVLEHRAFPSPTEIFGAPLVSTERFTLLGVD